MIESVLNFMAGLKLIKLYISLAPFSTRSHGVEALGDFRYEMERKETYLKSKKCYLLIEFIYHELKRCDSLESKIFN